MLSPAERHELEIIAKRTGSAEAEDATAKLDADAALRRAQIISDDYCARHLWVIAIEPRGKQPIGEWGKENIIGPQCQSFFGNVPNNVALGLGDKSGGLCDFDLDWPMAATIADKVLGHLPGFGRSGKPRSHRLFKCEKPDTTKKYALPDTMRGHANLPASHPLCVLEVRGTGHYTVFPPSINKDGQPLEWIGGGEHYDPPKDTIKWDEALGMGGLTAFLTVMATMYPEEGWRNDFSLALGGALLRALAEGYKDDDGGLITLVDDLVGHVCRSAGDRGTGRSWTHRAAKTLERMRAGKLTTGLHKLCEILGFDIPCEQRMREWLGMKEADDRPVIIWDELDVNDILPKAERAIIEAGEPVYQMAGRIVRPLRYDAPKGILPDAKGYYEEHGIKRKPGALLVRDIDETRLLRFFLSAANWKCAVYKDGTRREVRRAPPPALAKHYASSVGEWNTPVLTGISQIPTLSADGRLLTREGYDATSGLVLDFGGDVFPPIPDAPTKDEARAALDGLLYAIHEFPFVSDEDDTIANGDIPSASRSVALSMMLTGVCRKTMRTVPIHCVSAPVMNTGKSLLSDLVAIMATGVAAPTLALGADEEEDEKRFGGVLLQGDPVLVIDNIGRPVGGMFFASMMTQETVMVRTLGKTGETPVSTRVLIIANGNALTLAGDMATRAIICRIDSQLEDPGTRTFEKDLKYWAPEHRSELVCNALTVLRAFIVAGRPGLGDLSGWGRFDDWTNTVRGALVWLGQPDPCATRKELTARDPVTAALSGLMEAVKGLESVGGGIGKRFQASDLLTHAHNVPALYTAMEGALGGRAITAVAIGRYLNKYVGRIVDGLRFERGAVVHSASGFVLRQVGPESNDGSTESAGNGALDDGPRGLFA